MHDLIIESETPNRMLPESIINIHARTPNQAGLFPCAGRSAKAMNTHQICFLFNSSAETAGCFGPLDELLLLLRHRPLRVLERVQGLRQVVVKPLALKPPLTLLRAGASAGRDRVELAKLVCRLLGQLPGVVLDVVQLKERKISGKFVLK